MVTHCAMIMEVLWLEFEEQSSWSVLNFLSFKFVGQLSKASCSRIFAERGCILCLELFDSVDALANHKDMCQLPAPAPLVS